MAPSIDSTSLYGTLNLLILQALARESLHGLAIAKRIRESTDESLRIEGPGRNFTERLIG